MVIVWATVQLSAGEAREVRWLRCSIALVADTKLTPPNGGTREHIDGVAKWMACGSARNPPEWLWTS